MHAKKGVQAQRSHGLELQKRWDGLGQPPLQRTPPFVGLPAVEVTHPFHFKLSPGIILGPKCNHDLGILLRLLDGVGISQEAAVSGMLAAMGDHEFYCASYSSKDQPHIDGLLQTLADGMRSKERDIAEARAAGETLDAHEVARRIMHRLMSSTNRRMHKGFPEMLSYLLGKPMLYGSHTFVHLPLNFGFSFAISLVHHRVRGTTPDRPPAAGAAQHLDHTYATSSSRDAAPNGLLLRQPARLNAGDY